MRDIFWGQRYRYGILGLVLLLMYHLLLTISTTDLDEHAIGAMRVMLGEISLPPNFGYYGLVWLLAPSTAIEHVYFAATVVLATATFAKVWGTEYIIRHSVAPNSRYKLYAFPAAVLMALIGGIPLTYLLGLSEMFQFGHIWPNTWHNSTVIVLMPFALWLSYRSLRWEGRANPWVLGGICVLGVCAKPSFFFVWGPAYMLLLLAARAKIAEWLPLLAGVMAMGAQYALIYWMDVGNLAPGERTTGVVLAPGAVWGLFTLPWAMPVSVLMGALFPLSVAYLRQGRMSVQSWIGGLMYMGAIAIFFLFAEEGFRWTHANLGSQVVPATFICYLYVLIDYLRYLDKNPSRRRSTYLPIGLLLLQGVFGLYYVYGLLFTNFK